MDMSRRDFCRGSAGLAGILAAGAAPSLYAAGANERVRVACVGYSDRFRQSLLPSFRGHMKRLDFDLVAVADLWKKRLNEKAKPELDSAFWMEIAEKKGDEVVANIAIVVLKQEDYLLFKQLEALEKAFRETGDLRGRLKDASEEIEFNNWKREEGEAKVFGYPRCPKCKK